MTTKTVHPGTSGYGMTRPRIGSLCSGYGGLDLAVTAVLGGTIAWHADTDPAAGRVLAHHWPGVPNHGDITAPDWTAAGPVDVLTAGYPCQPDSSAGKRRGADDDRWIWPAVRDAVRDLGPRLVVLENVRGHVGRGFPGVVGDLADIGYDARWCCVPASAVGAPHRRERLFAVAYPADPANDRRQGDRSARGRRDGSADGGVPAADADRIGRTGRGAERVGLPDRQRQGSRSEAAGRGTAVADSSGPGLEIGGVQHHGPQRPAAERSHHQLAADAPGDGLMRDPGSAGSGPARGGREREPTRDAGGVGTWGRWAPAIERWERTVGPSPDPVELGRRGNRRLNPAFSEWMMGLPAGWVTAVPGLTRNDQLRLIGNGVIPQQAAAALRWLLADPVGATA